MEQRLYILKSKIFIHDIATVLVQPLGTNWKVVEKRMIPWYVRITGNESHLVREWMTHRQNE